MINLSKKIFAFMIIFTTHFASSSSAMAQNVYVIAPSISTSREAKKIMARQGWTESSPRQAEYALVVVRSSLNYPLSSDHKSLSDLEEDADSQFNLSGPNFVVYVFSLDEKLRPAELERISYPVKE